MKYGKKEYTIKSFRILVYILVIFLITAASMSLFSEDVWNGNATTIRRGEFDIEGYFAASNSFPLNSKIRVTNLATGKTAEVTIRKRIPDASSMFLLLSDQAAMELNIGPYDVVNVEVRVISYGVDEIIGLPDDLPYNPDPDFWMGTPRPVSAITPSPVPEVIVTPSPVPYMEPTPEPTPGAIEPTPEATPGIEEASPEPTAETTPGPVIEETPAPTPEPTTTPEPSMESALRNPQKNLYLLPHEDERFMAMDYKKSSEKETDTSKKLTPNEAIVEAKKLEKPVEGGIGDSKKIKEKETVSAKDLKDPVYESPQVIDVPDYTAYEQESELIASLPPVKKKESLVPEFSSEGYPQTETIVTLEPTEPHAPTEKEGAEYSEEYPRISESEASLFPEEPSVHGGGEGGEAFDTGPRVAENEVALEPGEPRVETKKTEAATPTDETPRIKEGEGDFTAVEPGIRDKTGDTQKEPTNGTGKVVTETVITLVPTEMQPPVLTKEQIEKTAETVELAKNSYFIQIGSFTDKAVAMAMKVKYGDTYPVIVYSPDTSKLKIYNVLIGPLNKPESDTLFFRFKANGIKDAFVKYVR